MRRPPECPKCPHPIAATTDSGPAGRGPDQWLCHTHGEVAPLWRPHTATYDDLAEHLRSTGRFPTYLPWPMPMGWALTDFAVVGEAPGGVTATMSCCAGANDLDGPVDVLIVTEEPGTGLGARCAGLDRSDPGRGLAESAPSARLKVGGVGVAVWPVSTSGAPDVLDRSVFLGEAEGRWLWLIFRPA
ncbi:MAG: DUF6758 family protein, partial [Nocardioides sp.]